MKKIIALVMAVMMLTGVCAFAEEAADPADIAVAQETYYDFELDYCPEGYEAKTVTNEPEYLLVSFSPLSAEAPAFMLSVTYSEENGDVTMPAKEDLSADDYQSMQNQFASDYNHPEFFYFDQTDKNGEAYGVIVVHETDIEAGDIGEIVSLWHGYMADIVMAKPAPLTEEDYRVGLQIVQELKVK